MAEIPEDLKSRLRSITYALREEMSHNLHGVAKCSLEEEEALIYRIASLEVRLAALDWRPITAEDLPDNRHELMMVVDTAQEDGLILVRQFWDFKFLPGEDVFLWLSQRGWTHFRPINPPQR